MRSLPAATLLAIAATSAWAALVDDVHALVVQRDLPAAERPANPVRGALGVRVSVDEVQGLAGLRQGAQLAPVPDEQVQSHQHLTALQSAEQHERGTRAGRPA